METSLTECSSRLSREPLRWCLFLRRKNERRVAPELRRVDDDVVAVAAPIDVALLSSSPMSDVLRRKT